jgi:hypothetical protein
MKTIKELAELNNTNTIEKALILGIPEGSIRSLSDAIRSFKYGIKLIGDTEICIYTNKDVDLQQVMNMPVSIDRRYNILVLRNA